MSEPVKGKTPRPYSSQLRDERAGRTRRAVIDAARELFLADGFAATTMPAIARRAGVSVQTVYKAFGNKPRLAKAVFDVAIAGDDEPIAMVDRPGLQRVREEPDARRKLQLYGDHLAETAPRHVPFQLIVRAAASSDPDAAAVWAELQDERLRGMTMFARHLHASGHLRPDITVDHARDVLWAYTSAELYDLLITQRGWPPQRYGTWVADALNAALTSLGED